MPAQPDYRVADLAVHDLLARIGSDAISPGSGIAGALALALAAACLHKAVTITLKHAPESSGLRSALMTLRVVATTALADGERDANAFEAFIHARSAPARDQLVCEGEQFGELITILMELADRIEPHVQANMAGDIFAARALALAARQIQQRNEGEAQKVP